MKYIKLKTQFELDLDKRNKSNGDSLKLLVIAAIILGTICNISRYI